MEKGNRASVSSFRGTVTKIYYKKRVHELFFTNIIAYKSYWAKLTLTGNNFCLSKRELSIVIDRNPTTTQSKKLQYHQFETVGYAPRLDAVVRIMNFLQISLTVALILTSLTQAEAEGDVWGSAKANTTRVDHQQTPANIQSK